MRFCNSSQLVESSKGGVDSNPKLTVTMDLPESAHWKYRTAARQLHCDFYSFLDCSRCSPFYALFDQNFLVEYKSARPWTRSFDAIYSPRSSPASNMLTHWAMWAIGWTKTFINFPTSPTFNWVKSYVVQDRGQRSRLALWFFTLLVHPYCSRGLNQSSTTAERIQGWYIVAICFFNILQPCSQVSVVLNTPHWGHFANFGIIFPSKICGEEAAFYSSLLGILGWQCAGPERVGKAASSISVPCTSGADYWVLWQWSGPKRSIMSVFLPKIRSID